MRLHNRVTSASITTREHYGEILSQHRADACRGPWFHKRQARDEKLSHITDSQPEFWDGLLRALIREPRDALQRFRKHLYLQNQTSNTIHPHLISQCVLTVITPSLITRSPRNTISYAHRRPFLRPLATELLGPFLVSLEILSADRRPCALDRFDEVLYL